MSKLLKYTLPIMLITALLVGCGASEDKGHIPPDDSSSQNSSQQEIVDDTTTDGADGQESTTSGGTTSTTTSGTNSSHTAQKPPAQSSSAPTPPETPPAPPEKTHITVSVQVSWQNAVNYSEEMANKLGSGIVASKSVTLPVGATAMDAINAMGLTVRTQGSYITGVNGLFEKDCGSTSGWMYKVNNKFPSVAITGYTLKDGDSLGLGYTINGGRDLA